MYRTFRSISLVALFALLLAACGGQQPATDAQGNASPAAEASAAASADGAVAPAASEEPTAVPEQLGSGSTKIVVWHRWEGEYYNNIKQIFADYATQNNVQIELLLVPDVANKAQVAVPSGQGPDIIAWVNDRIGSSALNEIIQPLDDYGVTQEYLTTNFAPVAAEAMVYNGKVYGIPESMEAITFIYNKAMISEADLPQNTDELISKAKEYNAANPGKYFFVYNAKGDIYAGAPWWQGAGVTLVTPDGTTEVASAEGTAAANLIKSFSEIMPQELAYDESNTLFMDQKAAIIMNGPWVMADYAARNLDVGLATIPVVSSSGQPGKPFVGVKLLMLAQQAKNAEAAVALMQHYGSAEVQTRLAEINKQVPANIEAQEQVKDDPIIAAFIAQTANGEPMPNTEFINAMWDPFNKMTEVIWTGAATPEQAVQDAAALFEESVVDLK